jgi:hypothetical protein
MPPRQPSPQSTYVECSRAAALASGWAAPSRASINPRYWRYVYGDSALLFFCAATAGAVLLWPDYFR